MSWTELICWKMGKMENQEKKVMMRNQICWDWPEYPS